MGKAGIESIPVQVFFDKDGLAGPALSLPGMIALVGIMGTKRTGVYILLVVAMAAVCGVIFGAIAG